MSENVRSFAAVNNNSLGNDNSERSSNLFNDRAIELDSSSDRGCFKWNARCIVLSIVALALLFYVSRYAWMHASLAYEDSVYVAEECFRHPKMFRILHKECRGFIVRRDMGRVGLLVESILGMGRDSMMSLLFSFLGMSSMFGVVALLALACIVPKLPLSTIVRLVRQHFFDADRPKRTIGGGRGAHLYVIEDEDDAYGQNPGRGRPMRIMRPSSQDDDVDFNSAYYRRRK